MIATDNQLRVTQDRLQRFSTTLAKLLAAKDADDTIARARVNAIQEQIDRLRDEVEEDKSLRSGDVSRIDVPTLKDLPNALIKARIGRSLSQSALGELIGVKAQQVQRWESEGYRKVSLERLEQIAHALKLNISERIEFSNDVPVTPAQIRRGLTRMGLPKNMVERRLIPAGSQETNPAMLMAELEARMKYVFGISGHRVAKGARSTSDIATQIQTTTFCEIRAELARMRIT